MLDARNRQMLVQLSRPTGASRLRCLLPRTKEPHHNRFSSRTSAKAAKRTVRSASICADLERWLATLTPNWSDAHRAPLCCGAARQISPAVRLIMYGGQLLYQLFFIIVVLIGLAFGAKNLLRRRAWRSYMPMIYSLIYLLCLWVPAQLQITGQTTSKLVATSFVPALTADELAHLSFRWGIELGLLLAVDFVVRSALEIRSNTPARERRPSSAAARRHPEIIWRRAATLLVTIGTLANIAMPAPNDFNRANSGQGIPTLLREFLVAGIMVAVYFGCFKRAHWVVICVAGVALVLSGNARSPLLDIFIALITLAISRDWFRRGRRIVLGLVAVLIVAFLAAYMSNLRDNVLLQKDESASQVWTDTLHNPWVAPYKAGIDTLDGYRLSEYLISRVPPDVGDLAQAVTNYIPRAIWSSKPSTLSAKLSAEYLGYGASGQYLSPVGYLSIVFNGYGQGLVALAVFAGAIAFFAHRFRGTFWLTVVAVITFRFMLGGSSLDIAYGLNIVIVVALCLGIASITSRKVPARDCKQLISS